MGYSISVIADKTSAYVTFDGLDVTYANNDRDYYYWINKGSPYGPFAMPGKISEFSFTVSGLAPNTYFTIEIEVAVPGYGVVTIGSYSFWTDYDVIKPQSFIWDIPKIKGYDIEVTATEWNDFTKRINAFRSYKGYSQKSFTNVLSSGITGRNVATEADGLPTNALVSASIINEAIQATNDMFVSDLLPTVNQEEEITAQIFNDMVDKLNSIS